MRFEPKGLTLHMEGKATPGFTLFSPLYRHETYLIDLEGEIVHQWRHSDRIGSYARLLANGNLLSSLDGGATPEGILPHDPHFLDNGHLMLFANRVGQMPLDQKSWR